jgi:hypothetical protein
MLGAASHNPAGNMMRVRRRSIVRDSALAAVLVGSIISPVVLLSVVIVTSASAEVHTCTGSSGFYFDGAVAITTNVIGTSANIVNRLGEVCDTITTSTITKSVNTSSGWAMIQGARTCQYAQSGFVRTYGGTDFFFAQDNKCTGAINTTYGSQPSYGQTHHYWEEWLTTCGCVRQIVDSTIFQHTPWNPKTKWTKPFASDWLGETHYLASDVPGNPTEGYTTFTKMQVQKKATSSFTNALPTITYLNGNGFRYDHDSVVRHTTIGNVIDIWTYYEY